jgi:hypothetical protein
MLDSRRPGDPPDVTSLKRERSGARKILTVAGLQTSGNGCATRRSSSATAPSTWSTWAVLHFEEAASAVTFSW